MQAFAITKTAYLYNESYIFIYVLENTPDNTLSTITKKINIPDADIFNHNKKYKCKYVFMNPDNLNEFADYNTLIIWLRENNFNFLKNSENSKTFFVEK